MATKTCPDCGKRFDRTNGAQRCTVCAHARTRRGQRAGRIVSHAIRNGALLRQTCEVCGAVPADAHHDDYAKPLNVRWLCRSHHQQHHALQERAAAIFATVAT